MIIIAFSNKTSKIFPRIFCGKLKHVAPIIINNNRMIMMHQGGIVLDYDGEKKK